MRQAGPHARFQPDLYESRPLGPTTSVVRRERRVPLSRPVLCGIAIPVHWRVGRGVVSHRSGRGGVRAVDEAMEYDRPRR